MSDLPFQVTTVDKVPEKARAARGVYAKMLEKVPDPPQAAQFTWEDAKQASTRVAGLRGYLNRNKLTEAFNVVRQGNIIFVSKIVPEAEQPKAKK